MSRARVPCRGSRVPCRGSRVPCRGFHVEGRGFHVEGEGAMSRLEGNIFFQFFFFEKVIIDAINVIKTNKKNLKNKWRVNIF